MFDHLFKEITVPWHQDWTGIKWNIWCSQPRLGNCRIISYPFIHKRALDWVKWELWFSVMIMNLSESVLIILNRDGAFCCIQNWGDRPLDESLHGSSHSHIWLLEGILHSDNGVPHSLLNNLFFQMPEAPNTKCPGQVFCFDTLLLMSSLVAVVFQICSG